MIGAGRRQDTKMGLRFIVRGDSYEVVGEEGYFFGHVARERADSSRWYARYTNGRHLRPFRRRMDAAVALVEYDRSINP
jgi:hypothetical protein